MSDKSFSLVNQEVVQEVLEAAAANADAVEHLTEYCGCATFRYGKGVYLIITPKGNDVNDSHVAEVLDPEMLEEIGPQTVRCGNPVRRPLGRFLKAEGMEESDFFRTLVAALEESARINGTELPDNFFDEVPQAPVEENAEGDEVTKEIVDAISAIFEKHPDVLQLLAQRTPRGVEINIQRIQVRKNPFAGLGRMVLGGGNGIQGILQALQGARARREAPEQPAENFDFEAFLKANGVNLGDGDGDGDGSLEDTELNFDDIPDFLREGEDDLDFSQFGGSAGASFGDDIPRKGTFDPSMFADDDEEEE